jgi:hypothetical protein
MVVWCMGVCMLASVLVLQTCLGQYQSWVADAFGRAPSEGMFYMHALSLPGFAATLPDLLRHAARWSASPATGVVLGQALARASAPGASAAAYAWAALAHGAAAGPLARVPIMWTYVALNVVAQYVCIKGVYQLTPIVDPLSVNVVLTVRKFVSLLVSIYLFNNTFTAAHWAGAVLVFGGAMWYGQLPSPPKPKPTPAPAAAEAAAEAAAVAPASAGAPASGLLLAGSSRDGRRPGAAADGGGGGSDAGAATAAGGGDEERAPPRHTVSGVAASGAGATSHQRHKADAGDASDR